MSTVIIGNNSFNKEKEENKFKVAKALFYNLGYSIQLDEENHLSCSKIIDPKKELSQGWYIDYTSFNSISIIKDGALVSFERYKDITDSTSFYKYHLAIAHITKFNKEDLELIDSILGSNFFYVLNISGD